MSAEASTTQEALDGTVGGKLDPDHKPEDVNNTGDGEGVRVVPQPNDLVNRKIKKAIADIDALKSERSAINAKISAIIESLEADGINRHSFRYTMLVLGMKESQRQGLDLSYLLCRQATDLPMQQDWIKEQEKGE